MDHQAIEDLKKQTGIHRITNEIVIVQTTLEHQPHKPVYALCILATTAKDKSVRLRSLLRSATSGTGLEQQANDLHILLGASSSKRAIST